MVSAPLCTAIQENDSATIPWYTWRQYPAAYISIPNTDYSRSGYRAQEYELHTADTGSTTDACIQQDTDRGNKAMHTATYKYKSQCGSDIGFSRKTDETSDALL